MVRYDIQRDKEIYDLYQVAKWTLRKIGEKYGGLSRQRVHQIVKRHEKHLEKEKSLTSGKFFDKMLKR